MSKTNLELSARDKLTESFRQSNEKAKNNCQAYVEKCTEIAKNVKKKFDEISEPDRITSFEDKLKTEDSIASHKLDFIENMKLAYKELQIINDRSFKDSVEKHLGDLNEAMHISKKEMNFLLG